MPHQNEAQIIALYVLPMITGSISFLGSSTICVSIMTSNNKFNTPYRRLVFGLSIADVIQSFSMILGAFAIPQGSHGSLWAKGNTLSCNIQGLSLHIGFAGVPMYTLSLCLYYLCIIKMNMNDADFSKRVEPYLHLIGILWTFAGGAACWMSGSFNVLEAGNMCWYTPLPADCVSNDEIECIRGQAAFTYGWIFGGSNFVTLCGIIYCLNGVCRAVVAQEKRNDKYRFRGSLVPGGPEERQGGFTRRVSVAVSSLRKSSNGGSMGTRMSQAISSLLSSGHENDQATDALATYTMRSLRKSMARRRETMTQASLYIAAFIWTCCWAYLYGFLVTIGVGAPYIISILLAIFYPLGGFLNLIVYTRLKVNAVQKKRPDFSKLKAFCRVIMAGGDIPDQSALDSRELRSKSNCSDQRKMSSRSENSEDMQQSCQTLRKQRQSRISFRSSMRSSARSSAHSGVSTEEIKEEIRSPSEWKVKVPSEVSLRPNLPSIISGKMFDECNASKEKTSSYYSPIESLPYTKLDLERSCGQEDGTEVNLRSDEELQFHMSNLTIGSELSNNDLNPITMEGKNETNEQMIPISSCSNLKNLGDNIDLDNAEIVNARPQDALGSLSKPLEEDCGHISAEEPKSNMRSRPNSSAEDIRELLFLEASRRNYRDVPINTMVQDIIAVCSGETKDLESGSMSTD